MDGCAKRDINRGREREVRERVRKKERTKKRRGKKGTETH
jgi:hypothetical protein